MSFIQTNLSRYKHKRIPDCYNKISETSALPSKRNVPEYFSSREESEFSCFVGKWATFTRQFPLFGGFGIRFLQNGVFTQDLPPFAGSLVLGYVRDFVSSYSKRGGCNVKACTFSEVFVGLFKN